MPKVKLSQKFVNDVSVDKTTTYTDVALSGFQVWVGSSGTKTYYYKYSQHNKQFKERLGRHPDMTYKEAKASVLSRIGELTSGVNQASKKVLFKDFISDFFTPHKLTHNKSAKESLKTIETHFTSWLGNYRMMDITPLALSQWKDRRLGGGVSPNTVKRNLTEISSALSYAVEMGFLSENPMARVKMPKEIPPPQKLYLTKKEGLDIRNTIDRYITAGQLYVVGKSFDDVRAETGLNIRPHVFPYYLPYAILIALNTGMRQGELFSLKWADIDPEEKVINVRPEAEKSGRGRSIKINEGLLRAVMQWRSVYTHLNQEEVAKMSGNTLLLNKVGTNNIFPLIDPKKAMKTFKANSGQEHINWHHYRHNFASQLVLKGATIPIVMNLMGHSKLETTQKYLSVRDGDKARAVALLDDIVIS